MARVLLVPILVLLCACRTIERPGALAGYTLVAFPGDAPAAAPQKAAADAGPAPIKDYHEVLPGLKVGASLRTRYELKRDFAFDNKKRGNDQDYFLTRLRVNIEWTPADWISIFVEGQDARIFGEETINEKAVPQIFQNSLDLHQAYVDLKLEPGGLPVRVRAGRQKLVLGAQRLVSPLEWVNTARVFDAVRVTVGKEQDRTLDLWSSRLVSQDDDNFDDWEKHGNRMFDSDFHGVYYTDWKTLPDTRLEAYWLLRHESNNDDRTQTVGGRVAWKRGPFDAGGELAGQFGEFGGDDHRAWAVHVEAGYTVESWAASRFGLAYNFASGDDDRRDGTHHTFDNLYPLNHAYYGYMDFFSWINMHNLEATWQAKLFGKLVARVAYHAFWLAEEDDDAWFNAGGGVVRRAGPRGADPYVGSEVDLTLNYPVWDKHLWVEVGYSHFWTGSFVRQTGRDEDADFFYLQTLLKF